MKKILLAVALIAILTNCTKEKDAETFKKVEYVITGEETRINYFIEYALSDGTSSEKYHLDEDKTFTITAQQDSPVWCKIYCEGYCVYEISVIVDGVTVDYFNGKLSHHEILFMND